MARRRKRQEEEHENHERWLVSYADFITLLFAFFVVMYAISSVNEGKYRVLSSAIVDAFRSGSTISVNTTPPSGGANTMIEIPETKPIAKAVKGEHQAEKKANTGSAQGDEKTRLANLTQDLAKVMDPLVKSGQVTITHSSKGVTIDIRDTALFPTAQAQPNEQSRQLMANMALQLAKVDNPIRVEGFTDTVPIRNSYFPSNWELSASRAGSVVRLFQENGIKPERLVAVGRGANLPVGDNATADGRASNRRVAITVLASGLSDAEVLSPQDASMANGR
ncbi:flagellar motor protein MotD [Chromobacterium haemolyticum]|uniref:Flagellar motor protein MotD n=1 Tax=Chromobacterium haemolyticum TaxID=394935 RepID=A0A1W0D1Y9_9NEIS|nr:flagellar motor protein MotD [Chromobacterium haemolyticum]OQS41030.1 flagellar motor protein MotD [Chromobacterium haemolyticum]